MNDLTLKQALEWVAFGTFDVPFAQHANEGEKITDAKSLLYKAFLSGCVRITSQGNVLNLTHHCAIDWDGNRISESGYFCDFPFTAPKTDIKVNAIDLMREFPPTNNTPITPPYTQVRKRRHGASEVHDIAYFLWEKEPNLGAKDIYHILNTTLIQYPKFKNDAQPAKISTVAQWLRGFRNKSYVPANTKPQIIKKFPGIFDKLRKSHK